MPDVFGISYNGVKPCPTQEELLNFVDCPVKFLDKSATFAKDSPLLTELGGIGMLKLEELERKESIEIQNEDMIRQIATHTGTSAQMRRALKQVTFNTPTESLAESRTDDGDELTADHVRELEQEQRRSHDLQLRAIMDDINKRMAQTY